MLLADYLQRLGVRHSYLRPENTASGVRMNLLSLIGYCPLHTE